MPWDTPFQVRPTTARETLNTDLPTRKREYYRRYRERHREAIRQRQRARRASSHGLGARQRQILLMAYDRAQGGSDHAPRTGHVLLQRDIFKQLYGWTITPGSWGEWFNPVEIGLAAYRTASGHVSRSITQLCKRGLLQRGERRGHLLLTPEGYRQAQALAAKNQAAACTAHAASRQGSLFPPTGTD